MFFLLVFVHCVLTKEEYIALHIRVRRGDDDSDDDSDDADTFDDARRPSLEFVRGKRRAFISSERSKTPLFLLSKKSILRGRSEQNVVGRRGRRCNGFFSIATERANDRADATRRPGERRRGRKGGTRGGGEGEGGRGVEEKERTNGTEENEEKEEQGRFGRTELERG